MVRVSKEEISVERNVSVGGRVDLVKLADIYLAMSEQRIMIRSMSDLLRTAVDVAHSALEQNGFVVSPFKGVGEAYDYLLGKNIITRGMQKKNLSKITMAWGFENMRLEGDDPRVSASMHYNRLHNTHSVRASGIESDILPSEQILDNTPIIVEGINTEEDFHKYIAEGNEDPFVYGLHYNEDGTIRGRSQKEYVEERRARVKRWDEQMKKNNTKIVKSAATTKEDLKKLTTENGSKLDPKEQAEVDAILAAQKKRIADRVQREKEAKVEAEKEAEQLRGQLAEIEALTTKIVNKEDDTPRAKTEEELKADALRIEEKDRKLMAELDKECSLPKAANLPPGYVEDN